MADSTRQPTAVEVEQATLAHHEIAETVNRMAREGFPATILMAGLAACCADLITCAVGIEQVPKWFAEQALASLAMVEGEG